MNKFDEFVKNARTITVKSDDTTLVIRESLGFDVLDNPYTRGTLGDALAEERGLKSRTDLSKTEWGRVIDFVELFPRMVSAEGEFALILPEYPSGEDYLKVFWEWLYWPASLMRAAMDGLKKADSPVTAPKAKKSE